MSSPAVVRKSADNDSSPRSSMSDLPVPVTPTSPFATEGTALRHSLSSTRHSMEELDIEDPLSRVYNRDEFEPFSKTEWGFVTVSCIGVVAVPLLYLLVSRIGVSYSQIQH